MTIWKKIFIGTALLIVSAIGLVIIVSIAGAIIGGLYESFIQAGIDPGLSAMFAVIGAILIYVVSSRRKRTKRDD
jgi:hypothetical protein